MSAQESKPGWYVYLDGRKAGPYTLDQVREMMAEKRVQADPRIYTEAETAGADPSEKTSNRIHRVGELMDQYTDPALSLLDALQAAKSRRKQQFFAGVQAEAGKSNENPGGMLGGLLGKGAPGAATSTRIPPQLWTIGSLTGAVLLIIWGSVSMLKHGATQIHAPEAAKEAKVDASPARNLTATPSTYEAPRAANPTPIEANPSRTLAAMPIEAKPFAPGSLRGAPVRSLTPPLQARPMGFLKKPDERPSDADHDRDDRDREREREDREREARDREDRSRDGGGGAVIDADPGNTTTGVPQDPNNLRNNGGGSANDPSTGTSVAIPDPSLNQN